MPNKKQKFKKGDVVRCKKEKYFTNEGNRFVIIYDTLGVVTGNESKEKDTLNENQFYVRLSEFDVYYDNKTTVRYRDKELIFSLEEVRLATQDESDKYWLERFVDA